MALSGMDTEARPHSGTLRLSPLLVLSMALVAVSLLMALPLTVPIGPMYWDVMLYYDAAARMLDGQMPAVDFFTPVGPLGYWLFTGLAVVFPNANPTLIAHWSLLLVTAPLMAIVLIEVDRRSRPLAFALLIPFLIFALLPFNTREFYPYPGSDGFGIYNRQVAQLLYVLMAILLFVKSRRRLTLLIALTMIALFLTKVTGVVAGGLLCVYAFASGRVTFRSGFLSLAVFLAILIVLEAWNGLVSAYTRDILALVAMNTGSLAPRFLQAASQSFGVIAPGGALILLILWHDRRKVAVDLAGLGRHDRAKTLAALLDRPELSLGVAMAGGIVFETQNTGSQAMILVWPALLAVLVRIGQSAWDRRAAFTAFTLAAAMALPPVVNIVERAARTYAGGLKNQTLEHANLKTLGAVSMRPEVAERAAVMPAIYEKDRQTYRDIADTGMLATPVLYSDYDFQINHLQAIDHAIDSLHALEAQRGIRFETIMTINFVNPFPWLMDRSAPRHIAIGADPTRAVPPPDAEVAAAVGDVDIALYPTCPPTNANAMLFRIYRPLMPDHRRITLDRCYDAWVHPRFGLGSVD